MERSLNLVERRVLGSLLEKSMAQPDYYPMTLKALTAACNQKQNRCPVMDLDEDEVYDCLEELRKRSLVVVVLPGPGSRSKRYKHDVETQFGWHKRERAVMAELLLRGPQTVGELRTRCARFIPFDDLEAVQIVLDHLAEYDPPFAKILPREPGQSAQRFTHLLYPNDESPQIPEQAATTSEESPSTSKLVENSSMDMFEKRLTELQNAVADIQERLQHLENQLL